MSSLWRGNWEARLRIASGLVLFVFAMTHFLNVAAGLASEDAMLKMQALRKTVTRSDVGSTIIYAALVTHAGLAVFSLARRRSLRMPPREALQFGLGLAIPFLLAPHIVFTRVAHAVYGVDDRMTYLIARIFGTPDGWRQALLLLIVWVHGSIGIRMWLGREPWWQRHASTLTAGFVLVPTLALCGYIAEGRRVLDEIADNGREAYLSRFSAASPSELDWLRGVIDTILSVTVVSLLAALALYAARRVLQRRKQVRIRYTDGKSAFGRRGLTLLEMSREAGIPHAAQCGGRGRCTTCRIVVVEGADRLAPPSPAEARSLRAVGAGPETRLACQVRPSTPLLVHRVFKPDGTVERLSESGHGEERRLAILFLDIRGFTALTTGRLPYDVVFLLNRFFDSIVPAIGQAGGVVDKYLGDGLLALFDMPTEKASAEAALRATAGIGRALEAFNVTLADEGAQGLKIGIGVHLGELVIGEIGAFGQASHTIIGEAVNTASRIEAVTKDLGVEALVSETVLDAAGLDLPSDLLTAVSLRGVSASLRVLPLPRAAEADSVTGPLAKGQRAAEPA